jgi:hypothetical protein
MNWKTPTRKGKNHTETQRFAGNEKKLRVYEQCFAKIASFLMLAL